MKSNPASVISIKRRSLVFDSAISIKKEAPDPLVTLHDADPEPLFDFYRVRVSLPMEAHHLPGPTLVTA
jgi:hypothetical protein